MQKQHPDKWLSPYKDIENIKIKEDENLLMILAFSAEEESGIKEDTIFLVIEKENNIIAKLAIKHTKDGETCDGCSRELAEYPIEDKENLINEIGMMGSQILMELVLTRISNSKGVKINIENQPFLFESKNQKFNKEELIKEIEKTPKIGSLKENIIDVLGLKEASINEMPSKRISLNEITPDIAKEREFKRTPEGKLRTEKDIIAKFGKKNIEKLAKAMGYKGITINNE